ncbi:hypothetical protein C8J57DRAFT_1514028 [Mycena rebaudengoi]|nr:hypothetical protein C8J57DRAFT_1514028 [Mycena rebaudengoi]
MKKPLAAQKRKKKRAEREELQRIEEEKAQHAPVSTSRLFPSPATPVLGACAHGLDPDIHSFSSQPLFDSLTLIFSDDDDDDDDPPLISIHNVHLVPDAPTLPPGHPAARWPEHVRAFVYSPVSFSPSPPPRWCDDVPEVAAIHIRTIRRRKHRLRTGQCWEPPSCFRLPTDALLLVPSLLPPPLPLLEDLHPGFSLRPSDLLGMLLLHPGDPILPDNVPPDNLPPPSLCLFPDDHPPS